MKYRKKIHHDKVISLGKRQLRTIIGISILVALFAGLFIFSCMITSFLSTICIFLGSALLCAVVIVAVSLL